MLSRCIVIDTTPRDFVIGNWTSGWKITEGRLACRKRICRERKCISGHWRKGIIIIIIIIILAYWYARVWSHLRTIEKCVKYILGRQGDCNVSIYIYIRIILCIGTFVWREATDTVYGIPWLVVGRRIAKSTEVWWLIATRTPRRHRIIKI